MIKPRNSELVFEVTEDINGGCVAQCLTESIVTQGDDWDELRANVKDAVQGYFYDGGMPDAIRLHLIRDEVLMQNSAGSEQPRAGGLTNVCQFPRTNISKLARLSAIAN